MSNAERRAVTERAFLDAGYRSAETHHVHDARRVNLADFAEQVVAEAQALAERCKAYRHVEAIIDHLGRSGPLPAVTIPLPNGGKGPALNISPPVAVALLATCADEVQHHLDCIRELVCGHTERGGPPELPAPKPRRS